MLILLIAWCILFFLCLTISEFLRIKEEHLFNQFFLGLAILSIYLQVWAIFFPVQSALAPLFLLALLALFNNDLRIRIIAGLNHRIKSLGYKEIIILLTFLFLSSAPGYINDDAFYYQQTIKWLADYGYVKGLANINIPFGLSSSWHLISAAFYFDELPFTRYYNFNGLFLFVLIITLLKHFQKYEIITLSVLLFIGSLFLAAPSPDLVVLSGTLWLLLMIYKIKPIYLALIIGFLISVKVTAAGLLLFLIPSFWRNKSGILAAIAVISLFGAILIIKNYIITGHPFFPMIVLNGIGEHQVPVEVVKNYQIYSLREIADNYHVNTLQQYDFVYNYWNRFVILFQVRSYRVAFNLLCILAFLTTPLLLIKRDRKNILLAVAILFNGFLWFWFAPYYRFALGYIVFMFFIVADFIPQKLRHHKANHLIFIITVAAVLIIYFKIKDVLFLVDCGEPNKFQIQNTLYPVDFNKIDYQKSGVFNITDCSYCYNAPLPCYSLPVLNYYVQGLKYNPVPVDPDDISKGFVMEKLQE